MINFQIDGYVPFPQNQQNQFPKSIAIDSETILFLSGNINVITVFRGFQTDKDVLEIRMKGTTLQINNEKDMELFLSQFPEETFEKASRLRDLYVRLINPF